MNKISPKRFISLITIAIAATGTYGITYAEQSDTVVLQHAKGRTTVPTEPKRVVVYDLATLDIMHALDIPVTGVARAQYPAYLSKYADAKYQTAGSLFEPDYAALSRIQPDLIIVGGRSSARYDVLSKIAPTLDFSLDSNQPLEDMNRNVQTLANLYGKQTAGKQLMDKVHQEIDKLKTVAAQADPALLVLAINTNISGQTPGSRFGLFHDVFGIKSVLANDPSRPRGIPLKMEDISRLNPQWLFVIDRNAGTGTTTTKDGKPVIPSTTLFDNEQIKKTNAGEKGQVVFLDPKGWYLLGSAGPVTMINNAKQIRFALEKTTH